MTPTPGPSNAKSLKHQPKQVQRRSLQERQRLEREEAERQQARAQAARDEAKTESESRRIQYGFHDQWKSGRGRANLPRGRGGRGGFMGDRRGPVPQGQLSGIGSSIVGHDRRVRRHNAERWRGDGRSGPAGDRRARGSLRGHADEEIEERKQGPPDVDEDGDVLMPTRRPKKRDVIKDEIIEEGNADDDEIEVIDLENLNLLSDTDGSMLPVTVDRTEHVDRQFQINTDSSAAVGHRKPSSKRKTDPDLMEDVKLEQDDDKLEQDDDAVPGVIQPSKPDQASSPEARPKPRRNTRSGRARATSSRRSNREEQLQDENRNILLEELGPVETLPNASDDKESPENVQDQAFNPREDSLYLFQLPPSLPPLAPKGVAVKEEPTSDGEIGRGTSTIETVEEAEAVKEEDTGGLPPETSDSSKNSDLPPGYLGKMQVWKSGKVTLDWGGVRMLVSKGVDTNFAETVVGMYATAKREEKHEEHEEHKEHNSDIIPGQYIGCAYSFGQLRGKMIVMPDWKGILGLEGKQRRRSEGKKSRRSRMDVETVGKNLTA